MNRPTKPAKTIRHAKRLRHEMSLPEALLWRHLRGSPGGIRFRSQHPAGPYVIDFFCARANLAIEVDGILHGMGDRPERDLARDAWLLDHRIDTIRIPASDVLRDPQAVAETVVALAEERLEQFGKAPPSAVPAATSPSQVDGEIQPQFVSPSPCDGEVATRGDDGGVA
ncbi:MAG: DUF559 domain-containing protein [Novosphingobium sp.]